MFDYLHSLLIFVLILATTADDDDAEDAAGAGKKSHGLTTRKPAPSSGHGQPSGGAEAPCLATRQHACNDQSSRTHTTIA